jgi:hypothetical protein
MTGADQTKISRGRTVRSAHWDFPGERRGRTYGFTRDDKEAEEETDETEGFG